VQRALTAEQSRAAESRAVDAGEVTVDELMRVAGEKVAAELESRVACGRILVLSGPGNNGGDGWVVARVLAARGREVSVVSVRDPDELPQPAGRAAAEAIASGVEWNRFEGLHSLSESAVIVDALLGTGSTLPLKGSVRELCEAIGGASAYVLSVDLPTGVDADSGRADPYAVTADCTVALGSLKRGHVIHPGADKAGEVAVVDIGLRNDTDAFAEAPEVWSHEDYARLLPSPPADAHKSSRGRLLVIAGSARYAGAAVLATRGAMRGMAGYVTLAVPEPIVAVVQCHLQAAPVIGLPASRTKAFGSSAVQRVLDLAHDYDAVVIGPGLTVADGAVTFAREVVSRYVGPLVVDADALNALVDAVELVEGRTGSTLLTPHPGEMARLLGVSAAEVQADRVSSSARLVGQNRAVVLKGAGTVVSGSGRCVVTTSGSVALATAGSGDVLAGLVGALLATGLDPFEAGVLGAHLHGRAGDLCAAELTPLCVTAEDLPERIPGAVGELLGTW
jgi:NAD(P)H-hydrate epimerase